MSYVKEPKLSDYETEEEYEEACAQYDDYWEEYYDDLRMEREDRD